MPTARYGLAVAVVDNKIYVIGGDSGGYGGKLKTVNEQFSIGFSLIQPPTYQETIIFYDNFESYNVGRLPTPTWEFWYNNIGSIVDTTYVSPTKSLRLRGSYGWSTEAIRRFSSTSRYIGYEIYGKVETLKGPWSLKVSFIKKTSPTTDDMIADVTFFVENGQPVIKASNIVLQSYVANKWYKIKVVYDRDEGVYYVWIDNVLKASVTMNYAKPYEIEGLALCSEWAEINCYFDDVKVFEGKQIPQWYILHVQSSPITGIQISYSGDYYGTGITNFGIGPKNSPFTVTLTAPLAHRDYIFNHWELDGINMGKSNPSQLKLVM